jgi:hypothetical protein
MLRTFHRLLSVQESWNTASGLRLRRLNRSFARSLSEQRADRHAGYASAADSAYRPACRFTEAGRQQNNRSPTLHDGARRARARHNREYAAPVVLRPCRLWCQPQSRYRLEPASVWGHATGCESLLSPVNASRWEPGLCGADAKGWICRVSASLGTDLVWGGRRKSLPRPDSPAPSCCACSDLEALNQSTRDWRKGFGVVVCSRAHFTDVTWHVTVTSRVPISCGSI